MDRNTFQDAKTGMTVTHVQIPDDLHLQIKETLNNHSLSHTQFLNISKQVIALDNQCDEAYARATPKLEPDLINLFKQCLFVKKLQKDLFVKTQEADAKLNNKVKEVAKKMKLEKEKPWLYSIPMGCMELSESLTTPAIAPPPTPEIA